MMRPLFSARVGLVRVGVALGLSAAFVGCTDETRQTGTQVEFDAAKQAEGMKRMQDYMQRKARGEVAGIPKTRGAGPRGKAR